MQDTRAAAYDHWRSLFTAADCPAGSGKAGADASNGVALRGRQIPLSEVPLLLDYDRGTDMELWELSAAHKCSDCGVSVC